LVVCAGRPGLAQEPGRATGPCPRSSRSRAVVVRDAGQGHDHEVVVYGLATLQARATGRAKRVGKSQK
jgi:hypothetical protein